MLLNTTIHAVVASTQAVAAHVIARQFVGSASPALFADVPKQKRRMRKMCWRYLDGQPSGDTTQRSGALSERCQSSLCRLSSGLVPNMTRALNQGMGCLTGTSSRT